MKQRHVVRSKRLFLNNMPTNVESFYQFFGRFSINCVKVSRHVLSRRPKSLASSSSFSLVIEGLDT